MPATEAGVEGRLAEARSGEGLEAFLVPHDHILPLSSRRGTKKGPKALSTQLRPGRDSLSLPGIPQASRPRGWRSTGPGSCCAR